MPSTRSEPTTRRHPIRIVRRGGLFLGALTVSAAIAGCGGNSAADIVRVPAHADGPAITTPDAQHNAADVSFADHVITGEQQAVAVGKLTDNNSSLPPVKALGTQVAAEGQRQISELTGFLSAWNAPTSPSRPASRTRCAAPMRR